MAHVPLILIRRGGSKDRPPQGGLASAWPDDRLCSEPGAASSAPYPPPYPTAPGGVIRNTGQRGAIFSNSSSGASASSPM